MASTEDVEALALHLSRQGVWVTPCQRRMVDLPTACRLLGLRERGLRKRLEMGRPPTAHRLTPGGRLRFALADLIDLRAQADADCP
jgi:hypothetical protein